MAWGNREKRGTYYLSYHISNNLSNSHRYKGRKIPCTPRGKKAVTHLRWMHLAVNISNHGNMYLINKAGKSLLEYFLHMQLLYQS
jgi:hypothetical protein